MFPKDVHAGRGARRGPLHQRLVLDGDHRRGQQRRRQSVRRRGQRPGPRGPRHQGLRRTRRRSRSSPTSRASSTPWSYPATPRQRPGHRRGSVTGDVTLRVRGQEREGQGGPGRGDVRHEDGSDLHPRHPHRRSSRAWARRRSSCTRASPSALRRLPQARPRAGGARDERRPDARPTTSSARLAERARARAAGRRAAGRRAAADHRGAATSASARRQPRLRAHHRRLPWPSSRARRWAPCSASSPARSSAIALMEPFGLSAFVFVLVGYFAGRYAETADLSGRLRAARSPSSSRRWSPNVLLRHGPGPPRPRGAAGLLPRPRPRPVARASTRCSRRRCTWLVRVVAARGR